MHPQSQYKVPIYAHFSDRSPEEDCIVYVKKTKAGGADKGGKIVEASFKNNLNVDTCTEIEKIVVELNKAKKVAKAKLDPIDKLVLGIF